MGHVDTTETLQTLVQAHRVLADTVARVIGAVESLSAESLKAPDPLAPTVATTVAVKKPPRPQSARGPKAKQLDSRVLAMLESRPGTSVAELEREIADQDVSRSRLEWSLRRLLAGGRISKSGNTCGARYSLVESRHTAQSSSLRVVG